MLEKEKDLLISQTENNYRLQNENCRLNEELETKKVIINKVKGILIQKILNKNDFSNKKQSFENINLLSVVNMFKKIDINRNENENTTENFKKSVFEQNDMEMKTLKETLKDTKVELKQVRIKLEEENKTLIKSKRIIFNQKQLIEQLQSRMNTALEEKIKLEVTKKELVTQLELNVSHIKNLTLSRHNADKDKEKIKQTLLEENNKTKEIKIKNTKLKRKVEEKKKSISLLENQLTLMDNKYIDLRRNLDWTRTQSKTKITKLEKNIEKLKIKLMIAENKR